MRDRVLYLFFKMGMDVHEKRIHSTVGASLKGDETPPVRPNKPLKELNPVILRQVVPNPPGRWRQSHPASGAHPVVSRAVRISIGIFKPTLVSV